MSGYKGTMHTQIRGQIEGVSPVLPCGNKGSDLGPAPLLISLAPQALLEGLLWVIIASVTKMPMAVIL